MAPTEGRVARPERRWGCRRGTANVIMCLSQQSLYLVHVYVAELS